MKALAPLLLCFVLVSCVGPRTLTIRTAPKGADIVINGKHEGKSPLTKEFPQTESLGIVAHKDGYTVGSATVPTTYHWFYAFLWTKNDPKARIFDWEGDEVNITMHKIESAADYRPEPLPAYTDTASFPKPGSEGAPALRPMPEL